MLDITSAQLDAWLATFMFPLARLLGLFAVAPLWSSRGIPMRIRLVSGLAITLVVLPALPPMPEVPADSWKTLELIAQQALIGIAIGFVMRLFFAAVDLAGEMIGLQMGLSFAIFFSPTAGAQTVVLSEFLTLVTLLLFLALDGHLMLVSVLVQSFEWLPVGATMNSDGWIQIVHHASAMFSIGVMMALPMIATLLIANIGLGILTRTAPQLNLFAVGFPITLTTGFIVLLLSVTVLGAAMQRMFEVGFEAVGQVLKLLAG